MDGFCDGEQNFLDDVSSVTFLKSFGSGQSEHERLVDRNELIPSSDIALVVQPQQQAVSGIAQSGIHDWIWFTLDKMAIHNPTLKILDWRPMIEDW